MKGKILLATLASFAVTSSADAVVISGFDASQFFSSGGTVVDFSFANAGSFPAQFSELDTVADTAVGLGPDSAAFGGSFWDGSFGSDNTLVTSFTAGPFTAGSTNLSGSSSLITTGFTLAMSTSGTAATLVADGAQDFGNNLSYVAASALSVVFSGDVSSIAPGAENWQVNLGAVGAGDITVEFSTDGATYSTVDTFTLSAVETEFTSVVIPTASTTGFFRLGLPAGATIDNVAVLGDVVPEPGTGVLLLTGLTGLARASRRRV